MVPLRFCCPQYSSFPLFWEPATPSQLSRQSISLSINDPSSIISDKLSVRMSEHRCLNVLCGACHLNVCWTDDYLRLWLNICDNDVQFFILYYDYLFWFKPASCIPQTSLVVVHISFSRASNSLISFLCLSDFEYLFDVVRLKDITYVHVNGLRIAQHCK